MKCCLEKEVGIHERWENGKQIDCCVAQVNGMDVKIEVNMNVIYDVNEDMKEAGNSE